MDTNKTAEQIINEAAYESAAYNYDEGRCWYGNDTLDEWPNDSDYDLLEQHLGRESTETERDAFDNEYHEQLLALLGGHL